MTIFGAFKRGTQVRRLVLSAALATAITALLVAAPASAELADGAAAAPIAVAESAAPGDSLPQVEQTETPAAGAVVEPAAVEPVATEEVTSAAESAATAVGDVVAPVRSDLSAVTRPIENAPSQRSVADSIPDVADEVGALTETAAVVSGARQQVSRLANGAHQASAKTIEGIRQGVAGTIAAATDRLPGVRTLPPTELLDSIASSAAPALPPSTEPMPEIARNAASGGALSFPELPQAGLFSPLNAIALAAPLSEYLAQPDGVRTVGLGASNRSDGGGALSSSLGTADSTLAGTTFNRFGSPAPVENIPLPAPGSPATTGSGSGGSSFVSIAALLALLALVAPATLRRPWEAPDFRAPTPFVCALERPG